MTAMIALIALCLAAIHALPPDKLIHPQQPSHSVKTRSIDINNAHRLAMESRLSNRTTPSNYWLEIEPYLEDGVFKGRVIINVTFNADTDVIEMHCGHNLDISEVKVVILTGEKEISAGSKYFLLDAKKPILNIHLNMSVQEASKGWIDIRYSGHLDDTYSSESFFKSRYLEEQTNKFAGATQLRPNNARRMFPCYDEPSYLATFQLKILRPKDMVTLTNTKYLRSEDIPGEPNAVWDLHEKTPLMPPSSFGLVVGEFKEIGNKTIMEDKNKNHIEIRVWGTTEFLPALEGVKERILRVLVEVADYWQLKLPLDKLDFVAMPYYHGVKPADNWGLIIFRESDLSSQGYIQLAQEIAYQWVGSYTTPAWWNYAHLNKALVGYVAAETAFKINNGLEMEGKWPMTVLYSIYYEFSKRYPHSRITGMKQETVCTKIELLLRMFNLTMGGSTFKQGLRNFISKRIFKTFTANDVWSAIEEAARQSDAIPRDLHIEAVTESWIQKDRLPLVTVKRDYIKGTALVTQAASVLSIRFHRPLSHIIHVNTTRPQHHDLPGRYPPKLYLRERPHDVPDAARMSWIIPLVMVRQDYGDFHNTTPFMWLQTQQTDLYDMPDKQSFIIINPEEIGPFPVNYDDENWHMLARFLQSNKRTDIPELTRAKLLHDAWNLAYAGDLSFDVAFDMTLFLRNETNHLVWDPVFTMIDHIGKHLTGSTLPKFQAYVRLLLTPLFKSLRDETLDKKEGWRKNLRAMTKSFLCQVGDQLCVRDAQEEYQKWMISPDPDEGNPVANMYICPVFKWGTNQEWDFGFDRVINFHPRREPSERTYLLKSLAGCATNEYKLSRLLNVTLVEGNANFTDTDIYLIFTMLAGSEAGRNALLFFFKNNWDVLKEKYFRRNSVWNSMLSAATSHFTTEEGMAKVSDFYMSYKYELGYSVYIIQNSLKNIKEEVHWSSMNLPIIEKWLDAYLAKFSHDEFLRI